MYGTSRPVANHRRSRIAPTCLDKHDVAFATVADAFACSRETTRLLLCIGFWLDSFANRRCPHCSNLLGFATGLPRRAFYDGLPSDLSFGAGSVPLLLVAGGDALARL